MVTDERQPAAQAKTSKRPLAFAIVGSLLLVLGLLWAALIAGYFLLSGQARVYADILVQIPALGMRMLIGIIVASPLPLWLFGIGLWCGARWARIGAIIFLALQALGLAVVSYFTVKLPDLMGGVQLDANVSYSIAGGLLLLNGLLVLFLALARPKC